MNALDVPPNSKTSKSFVFIVEKDGPADQDNEIRFDGGTPHDTSPRILDGGAP